MTIDELRDEMQAGFANIRTGLRAEIDASATSVMGILRTEIQASATTVVDTLRAEMKVEGETTRRHFDLVAEEFRDYTKALADGTSRNIERLNDHERRITQIERPGR
jgi:hypothetical protein